jgi:hypothetical protein
MGFNIGGALLNGAAGFLTGGPVGAVIGGVSGALSGTNGTSIAGNGINGAYDALNTATELDTFALNAQQAQFQSQMDWQSNAFNEMMDNRSEHMRESNQLRTLAMEQRKEDNSVTKEFIKSIGE